MPLVLEYKSHYHQALLSCFIKGATQPSQVPSPIGLSQTIGKLWTKVITSILCDYASHHSILSHAQEGCLKYRGTIVIVITNQDSTSSRLLPGSSYSCCIRNLHALVHKQCHPVHITTAHEILQRLCAKLKI
jgi:hypothetical protein